MGDLLRLSPWSGDLDLSAQAGAICAREDCSRTLYFFLIIVKSLQLRGRRQIAEPHKYCFMRVIVFLWRVFVFLWCVFSLFLFLTGWEFGLIPYN